MLLNCIVLGATMLFVFTRQTSSILSMKATMRTNATDKALSAGLSYLYSWERSRCP